MSRGRPPHCGGRPSERILLRPGRGRSGVEPLSAPGVLTSRDPYHVPMSGDILPTQDNLSRGVKHLVEILPLVGCARKTPGTLDL
ncbi:hypothetical protein EDD95_3456 [Streptomyces sp. CEV 2-1]|nr:hypothetical protein EDD95_3456 [Streptomyces sp. CEV 2-1]